MPCLHYEWGLRKGVLGLPSSPPSPASRHGPAACKQNSVGDERGAHSKLIALPCSQLGPLLRGDAEDAAGECTDKEGQWGGGTSGAFCSFVLWAEPGVSCALAMHLLQMSEWLSLPEHVDV